MAQRRQVDLVGPDLAGDDLPAGGAAARDELADDPRARATERVDLPVALIELDAVVERDEPERRRDLGTIRGVRARLTDRQQREHEPLAIDDELVARLDIDRPLAGPRSPALAGGPDHRASLVEQLAVKSRWRGGDAGDLGQQLGLARGQGQREHHPRRLHPLDGEHDLVDDREREPGGEYALLHWLAVRDHQPAEREHVELTLAEADDRVRFRDPWIVDHDGRRGSAADQVTVANDVLLAEPTQNRERAHA